MDRGDGPDIDLQIIGRTEINANAQAGATAAALQALGDIQGRKFRINYANRGSQPAKGATLRINIPEALRDGKFDIRAPGIPDSDLNIGSSGIDGLLPDLQPGDRGTIVLSWTGCLTCVVASDVQLDLQMETVSVKATLAGDINPGNDEASWTAGNPQFPGVVRFLTNDGLPYPYRRALTCQSPMIHGSGFKPNTNIFVHISAAKVAEVMSDANGAFDYQLDVDDGQHDITVGYSAQMPGENGLRLALDSTRRLDPMSLRFTGPNGLVVMPDPGFLLRNNGNFSNLKLPSGGEFDISVASCPKADVQSVGFVVDGPYTVAKPNDDDCEPKGSDACGPWSARITVPDTAAVGGVHAASAGAATEVPFSLLVSAADATEISESTIEVAATGTVRDATSNQPLENATVTLLQTLGDALNAAFAVWDSSSLGQSNPQTTGADGIYTYASPEGTLRLSVARSGYQSYTTADFASDGGIIERDILLSPEVAAKTTHTVEMTENGFEPAYLAVRPGSVVQFVNVDLDDHTATGSSWDSGLLAASNSYKVKLDSEGTFNYEDENGISSATIVVDKNAPEVDDGNFGVDEPTIYLPIVMK